MGDDASFDERGAGPKLVGPLSLRANFSWTFVGNVVYAVCQWAILAILAKLATAEVVGQYALGLAVTAPVIMFSNLALRAVQATDAKRDYEFRDYLGLRLLTTVAAMLVVVGIVLVAGYRVETSMVIVLVGATKAIESISDVVYGLLQQNDRMDRIAKSMIIRGLLSPVMLAVGLHVTHSIVGGVVALAITWAGVLATYDLSSAIQFGRRASRLEGRRVALRPRWDPTTLRRLAILALPLGVSTMLVSLNTNIPRYFIVEYLGERELGYYAAMAYLIVAGSTVVRALGQAASPRLARHYAAGRQADFRRLLVKLTAIGVLLGLAGIVLVLVAGREIMTLLYRPEYAEHVDVLLWLVVAATFSFAASGLGCGMTAAHYYRAQPVIVGVGSALISGLCWWLVPERGLLAAAWATVATNAFIMLAVGGADVHATLALGRRGTIRQGTL